MVVELRDAADQYELLEKEKQAKAADLKKALDLAKETHSKIRDAWEELHKPDKLRLEILICYGRSF